MCVCVLCGYMCVEAWNWLQALSSLALYLISIEAWFPLNPEFTVFAKPVGHFAVMTPVSASCMLGLQMSLHILLMHLLALYLLLSLPSPLPFHRLCKLKYTKLERVWLAPFSFPLFFRLLSGVLRVYCERSVVSSFTMKQDLGSAQNFILSSFLTHHIFLAMWLLIWGRFGQKMWLSGFGFLCVNCCQVSYFHNCFIIR